MRFPFFRIVLSISTLIGGTVHANAQEIYVPEEQQRALFEAAQQSETAEIQGSIGLHENALVYSYPKDLVPVYQVQQPNLFMIEFIPFGEDVRKNWSRMLTIQAFAEPVAQRLDPVQFVSGLGQAMQANCSGQGSSQDLGQVALGNTTAYRFASSCERGQTIETILFQVAKRKGELIVVQLASRRPNTAETAAAESEAGQTYFVSLLDQVAYFDKATEQAK